MNYTQNYQLNQWVASDRVLMEDFNEDNQKIEAALSAKADKTVISSLQNTINQKPELITGSYTGDGTDNRQINLGFRPKAVFLAGETGAFSTGEVVYGGLALDGFTESYIRITSTGFTVKNPGSYSTIIQNGEGQTYHYLVIK